MGSRKNILGDKKRGRGRITLTSLRKQVTDNQRQILNAIWAYYRAHDEWIPRRVLHHQMGKDFILGNINLMGGSIIWKMWELGGQDTYWLTLLGVILSDDGVEGEILLIRYFEYLRSEFLKNPEIRTMQGQEIGKALELTNEQLRYLRELIRIGYFWDDKASFHTEEWQCGVPREIDDLPAITDLREYVGGRVIHGYDPYLPLDPNEHTDYLLSKEGKESGREYCFIQHPVLRDQFANDWDELRRLREAKAWKSCVIISGGILEVMLLDVLKRDEAQSKACYQRLKTKSAPDLNSWDLVDLVDVAKELGVLSKGMGHLSHALREFRNLVHPGKQIREKVILSEEEAEIAFNLVQVCVRELSSKFR